MSYSLEVHKDTAINIFKNDIYDAIENDYYNEQQLYYININNFDKSKIKIINCKSIIGNAIKMIYEVGDKHFVKILYENCTYFVCKETKFIKISNNPFYTNEGYSFNVIRKMINE